MGGGIFASLTGCCSNGGAPPPKRCDTTVESPWADLFKTERDKAFFWSGESDGIRAQAVASELARKANGTTLEMRLEEARVPLPPWDPDNPAVECEWIKLSAAYAKRALGKVRAVIGKTRRAGGVWDTVELPSLAQNPKITEIILIDPATRRPTRVLKAADPGF